MTTDHEWTPMRGLMSAIGPLALSACICLAAAAAALVAAEPALRWIAETAHFGRGGLFAFAGVVMVVAAICLLPAWICGRLLAHRLTERIGFEGLIPTALGAAFLWAALIGASTIAQHFTGPHTWMSSLAVSMLGVEATVILAWRTWIDPE